MATNVRATGDVSQKSGAEIYEKISSLVKTKTYMKPFRDHNDVLLHRELLQALRAMQHNMSFHKTALTECWMMIAEANKQWFGGSGDLQAQFVETSVKRTKAITRFVTQAERREKPPAWLHTLWGDAVARPAAPNPANDSNHFNPRQLIMRMQTLERQMEGAGASASTEPEMPKEIEDSLSTRKVPKAKKRRR